MRALSIALLCSLISCSEGQLIGPGNRTNDPIVKPPLGKDNCPADQLICRGDPDKGVVCTCQTQWDCDSERKKCQRDQTLPGSGDWDCTWTEHRYNCEKPGSDQDVPKGAGGWNCKYDKEQQRVVCEKTPPNPDNTANGAGSWNCIVQKEQRKISCTKKDSSTPLPPDPCQGKTSAPALANSKAILFYAPANYKYGVNTYASGVRDLLQAAPHNYKVTMVTSVQDGVKFDECNLYRNYKQIWFFMPCNNLQLMDANSFTAVKRFYEYGGGVVLMTDNHYYTDSNPNTHCSYGSLGSDPQAWAGSQQKPSDAVKIAEQVLGIKLKSDVQYAKPTYNTSHPLAKVMNVYGDPSIIGKVDFNDPNTPNPGIYFSWMQLQIDPAGNKDLQFLPLLDVGIRQQKETYGVPTGGPWAGLIEVEKPIPSSTSAAKVKRLALVLTPIYCYHCWSWDSSYGSTAGSRGFHTAIANYFEKNVQSQISSGQPSPASPSTQPPFAQRAFADAQRDLSERYFSTPVLKLALQDYDKHRIVAALHILTQRRELSADQLIGYFDHPSYFVRHHAVNAIGTLPAPVAIKALQSALSGSSGKKRKLIKRALLQRGLTISD
ncbi:MAG: HEAT repeat domain-containing protein [Deltaproteobacteria bacterium]|nr:HEAT repeat domain-containing protein [Deltaproteobacteria bacterium]